MNDIKQRAAGLPAFLRHLWQRIVARPWPELSVLLLAALTRFWRLNYHSFWFDEVVSLRWAGEPAATIWDVTFHLVQEKHPPAYYLFLHYWQQFLGVFGLAHSDAALRASGSLLGVLTVLGVLLLASRLSGRATGLLAALLVALSPVLTWYSQELRMFQPAVTAIVWALYCAVRAWDRGGVEAWGQRGQRAVSRALWWLGMVLALEVALYSYLFSAFVLPAVGLMLLWVSVAGGGWRGARGEGWVVNSQQPAASSGGGTWRTLIEGIAALVATTLLFLPLAYNAWVINRAESPPGRAFADFFPNLWHFFQVFTVWRVEWPAPLTVGALVLLALLLVPGLAPWSAGAGPRAAADRRLVPGLLLIWIGVPLLVANILVATNSNVIKEDRYYIYLVPAVLWAVARGVVGLGKRRPRLEIGSGLLSVLLLALALPRLWTPAMLRENWRAAAGYMVAYQQNSPGLFGAGVAHVDYTHRALEWYLRQHYTFDELPIFGLFGGRLTPDQVETVIAPPLRGIEGIDAHTVWLTQSHLAGVDDERLVEGWLNRTYPLITEQYPAGVKLTAYALRTRYNRLPALSPQAVYPDAEVIPGLRLAACEVLTPLVSATDYQMHPPSGWVHVRLWWQAGGAVDQDYHTLARVVGPEGVWGEKLDRENEVLRRFPTRTWTAGEFVRDEADVNLNPVTPAGEYAVIVGLRDGAGQVAGQTVNCGQVRVRDG